MLNEIDLLQLVNASNPLEANFVPDGLINITNRENEVVQVVDLVWKEFSEMRKRGEREDQFLDLTSGYRSYQHQQKTLERIVERRGVEAIGKLVALPGQSEHQLGLGLDISNFTADGKMRSDPERFKWLHANCYKFGFIVRYKEGFTKVTGVMYEPWHLRYVGRKHSQRLEELQISLEEYVTMLTSEKKL